MAVEQYANNAATTLSGNGGSITSGATSLIVADASGFPTSGNFRILIGSEIIIVGAVSGTTFSSLTRGAEGTSAASHNDGDAVTHIVTAGSLAALGSVLHRTAAYGSIPAASQDGKLFHPSDGFHLYRDTGSAWVPWGPLYPMTDPNLQSWSWVNQGSASVATTNGGIYLDTGTASATDNLRLRVMTAPSTPYTVTAALLFLIPQVDFMFTGLCFRESSSGKIATLCIKSHSTDYANGFSWSAQKWTNPTTFSANYTLTGSLAKANNFGDGVIWMRIADDGSNRKLSISKDGQNFRQVHSVGRTDFLTADQVGFWANANNASYGIGLTVLSWKLT